MLVLSRKEAERIRLGESIVVTIIRVSGDKVRLGIEAPSDVLVLRDELEPLEKGRGRPLDAPPSSGRFHPPGRPAAAARRLSPPRR